MNEKNSPKAQNTTPANHVCEKDPQTGKWLYKWKPATEINSAPDFEENQRQYWAFWEEAFTPKNFAQPSKNQS